jgi:hypothetical protein
MGFQAYKLNINSLGPVAVKLDQVEVHAPNHDPWGVFTCDDCEMRFVVGPNRIYGTTAEARDCVRQLETLLKNDHRTNRSHANSYELSG